MVSSQNKMEIRKKWCKACGICYLLCPKKVLEPEWDGMIRVRDENDCIMCRTCEDHCPEYVIKIGG